ncbi:MAG: hypothetical protein SVR04_06800 [Spirochaetota bacterium]|nr:hypothetical protein [Spirochaetota bacterium]
MIQEVIQGDVVFLGSFVQIALQLLSPPWFETVEYPAVVLLVPSDVDHVVR